MITERNFNQEEIFINDEYARVVLNNGGDDESKHSEPIVVNSMIKTEDLFNTLQNNLGFQSEILPRNCRFIRVFPNGSKVLVMEDEPKVRTISFNLSPEASLETLKRNGKYEIYGLENFKRDMPYKLTLSFPYIIYVVELTRLNDYNNLHVFFRLHPITSFDDYLLRPALPNINESSQVCLGYDHDDKESLADATEHIINNFWFNKFNGDFSTNAKAYQEKIPELSDYFTWSYHTKLDPLFIFSVKWLPAVKYSNLQDFFEKSYSNSLRSRNLASNFAELIRAKLKSVKKDKQGRQEKTYESRDLTQSILIEIPSIDGKKTEFLSIGDELEIDNKRYYVEAFLNSWGHNYKKIVLEDDEKKKLEIDLVEDEKYFSEICKNFKVKNPKSIKVGKETISVGDLVYFKDNGLTQMVEKIIKTRDNLHQLKIGKYFYLESCFLTKNLEKITNLKFHDVELEKDKEYCILNESRSNNIFYAFSFATFQKYTANGGEVHLVFDVKNEVKPKDHANLYEDLTKIDINITKNSANSLVVPRDFSTYVPNIYRVNNKIFTNTSTKPDETAYLLKNYGIGFDTRSSIYGTSRCKYNNKTFKEYLMENIQKGSITFESVDQDISYRVGEEIIYIDWTKPEEMFKIQVIVGFECDDNYFYLLTQENPETTVEKIPLINLATGTGNFASVRKVCKQINELTVGLKLKAKTASIYDFPMKDCNEIKAFIIDDLYPLVLFSNYRTLPLSKINDSNFKIFQPGTKEYIKYPTSAPNVKIKIQDGDLFYENKNKFSDSIFCFVHVRGSNKIRYCRLMSNSGDSSYYMDYHSMYDSQKFANTMRCGLLLPRYKDSDLKSLPFVGGYPTIFSNVFKQRQYAGGLGIRRDWKGDL